MRKPVPYKKEEPKKNKQIFKNIKLKNIDKKKIILFIVAEIIIITLAIVTTAVVSMLFRISPFIGAGVSAVALIVFSIFIAKYFFENKDDNKNKQIRK